MPTDMKRIFSPSVWSGKKFSRKVFEEMKTLASEIEKTRMKTINFMEVCGTHTMAIAASGIRSMLPKNIDFPHKGRGNDHFWRYDEG